MSCTDEVFGKDTAALTCRLTPDRVTKPIGTCGTQVLGTAQRAGSAIGIAVIGTVLFGSLHVRPGPNAVASAFSHSAQLALLANLAFVLVALLLVIALPAGPVAALRALGLR